MRRLLLLATTLLALNSPANANSWARTRTIADTVRADDAGFWAIQDLTDSLGDLIGIALKAPPPIRPLGMSERGGISSAEAFIRTSCHFRGFSITVVSVVSVASREGLVVPPNVSSLLAKVDGVRHRFSVSDQSETGDTHFGGALLFLGESGTKLLHKAIKEELPVKIAVPIDQEPDEVFEWNMEGGAAAFAVFEEECSRNANYG